MLVHLQSEEVLSTYQKDLAEFGKELKKETFSVVDTSAKAIPEVPHLLESGAHQAQVWRETLISLLLSASGVSN
jgi:hypothetical protein